MQCNVPGPKEAVQANFLYVHVEWVKLGILDQQNFD